MHTVLSNGNGKFYTTMIYPCFSRSVCFSMGSPAWWRFGLCSSGSSLMSRWRDDLLVLEFQMWRRRCKQVEAGPIFVAHWIPYLFFWTQLKHTIFPQQPIFCSLKAIVNIRYHRIFTLSGLFRTCQATGLAAEVDPIAHFSHFCSHPATCMW